MEGTFSSDDPEHPDPHSDTHQPMNHPRNQREEDDTTQQQHQRQQQNVGAGVEQYQVPLDVANLVQAALLNENDTLTNSLRPQHPLPQDNRDMGISQIPNGQSYSQLVWPAPQPVPFSVSGNNDDNNDNNNALLAQLLQQYQLQAGSQDMQQLGQYDFGMQGIAGLQGVFQPPQPEPTPQQASQQQMLEILTQLLGYCVSQLAQPQQQQPQQPPSPFQFPLPPALLMNMLFQGNAMPQQQQQQQHMLPTPPEMPGFGSPMMGFPMGLVGGGGGGGAGGLTLAQAAGAPPGTKGAPDAASQGPKKRRKYRHEAFPQKLHRLIREAMAEGNSHICRFTDDGTQFQVCDTEAFQTEILPRYFRHGRIDSFKRLLHMYGFRRTQGTCE